jgi:hypothetical protein
MFDTHKQNTFTLFDINKHKNGTSNFPRAFLHPTNKLHINNFRLHFLTQNVHDRLKQCQSTVFDHSVVSKFPSRGLDWSNATLARSNPQKLAPNLDKQVHHIQNFTQNFHCALTYKSHHARPKSTKVLICDKLTQLQIVHGTLARNTRSAKTPTPANKKILGKISGARQKPRFLLVHSMACKSHVPVHCQISHNKFVTKHFQNVQISLQMTSRVNSPTSDFD